MDNNQLVEWLEELGYRVTPRETGWCEYFVGRDGECWVGRGSTRLEAIQDVLAQMFPSFAARLLVEQKFGRGKLGRDGADAAVAAGFAGMHAGSPKVSTGRLGGERPGTERMNRFSNGDGVARDFGPRILPIMDADQALSEMQRLKDFVSECQQELGLSTPDRQRLVILGWIARARWIQDMFPGDRQIEMFARDIAGNLGSFCKRWWPGNVRALQRHSNPDDVTRDLLVAGIHAPHPVSWQKIGDLADEALDRMQARDESQGCDDYGWSDGAPVRAQPPAADTMLREVADEVRAVTGALGLPKPIPQAPEPKAYATWVRKLRWLRQSVEDADTWADLAGRLRYLASTYGALLAEGAAELDPDFAPPGSWGALLGTDRNNKERSKQVRDIFGDPPAAGVARADLLAWLERALPFDDTHHQDIRQALEPLKGDLKEIRPTQLSEPKLRTRLSRLQQELEGGAPSALADSACLGGQSASRADEGEPVVLPAATLERILAATRSKKSVYVSTVKVDAQLAKLQETFQLAGLAWHEDDPDKIEDLLARIQGGEYELVFGALGFQTVGVDSALVRVCRQVGARYVRVNHGNPFSCLRALHRSLGYSEPNI